MNAAPIKVLLQTTIPPTADDWSIARFSLLARFLRDLRVDGGTSKVTGRPFNIAVTFEPDAAGGPAIAQSTFHHFADYNWDTRCGCPSFVTEPPGEAMARNPAALADTHLYVRNAALWLAGRVAEPR